MLQTKLFKPLPPRHEVRRQRLTQVLQRAGGGSVAFIVAGAGYGKSTAAAQWIESAGRRFGWLSIDGRDDTPARFWRGLAECVAFATGGVGSAVVEALRGNNAPSSIVAADRLVAELAGLAEKDGDAEPFCLVIDDYHHITHSDIHDGVARLISFLPPTAQLALLSRTQPPLPLARWRTTGRVIEVGSKELSLRATELRSMVDSVGDLNLTEADVSALHARTEGWPAAVQLSLLSLRESDDKAAAIAGFGGDSRSLSEYLLGEVFDAQEPELQAFCLLASVVRRMSAPLCEVMLGGQAGAAEALLESAIERGLLVVPLDDRGGWYRFHDLFREFLATRAGRLPKSMVTGARRRAAKWFEQERQLDEAIEQLLELQEFASAGRLIASFAGERFRVGDQATVAAWLQALPPAVRDNAPALLTATAWTLPDGPQMRQGGALVERAEKLLADAARADGDDVGEAHRQIGVDGVDARDQILSEAYMMRSYLARGHREFDRASEFARRSIELSRDGGLPLRARAYCGLGQDLIMLGDTRAAVEALDHGIEHAFDEQDLVSLIMSLAYSATCSWQMGQFDDAVRAARRVGAWLDEHKLSSLAIARWQRAALFPIFLERWQLDEARAVSEPLLSLVHGVPHQRVVIYQRYANLLRAARDFDGASRALDVVEGHFRKTGSRYTYGWASPAAQRAEMAILRGEPNQALVWLDEQRDELASAGVEFLAEGERWSAAFVDAHAGNPEQAIAMADDIREQCFAHDRRVRGISCDVIAAVAYRRLGHLDRARERFGSALAASAKIGAVHAILSSAGPRAAELLGDSSGDASSQWTAHLLTCCQQHSKGPVWRAEALAEPLSQRELQALALLARGLRNADIANEMGIRLSTVKAHLRNLYGKLGVQRRTQALSRARALGLIRDQPRVDEA